MLESYLRNDSVTVSSYQDMNIIKYSHLGVDWSREENRVARGLVLDNDGKILARPFDKFFNLNELSGREVYDRSVQKLSEADQGPIEVMDKLDGSLVIVFYHNGLRFASSGSLDGEHALMFEEAANRLWSFSTLMNVKELSKTHTLMFEYTSPSNKVVLDYKDEELRLIGIRETSSGKEYTMSETKSMTENIGIDYVKTLNLSNMSEVIDYIEEEKDIEGVVILFKETMKRVKIKTSEYLERHKEANALNIRAGGLTKANIEYIVTSVISEDKGHIDDLLARYRNQEVLQNTLKEADNLIKSISNFIKDIESLALEYDSYVEKLGELNYVDLLNNEVTLEGTQGTLPAPLVFLVKAELSGFHKTQREYKIIKDAINRTSQRKLMVDVDNYFGLASNYNHRVSAKSFVFNVLDYEKVWGKIAAFNVYK